MLGQCCNLTTFDYSPYSDIDVVFVDGCHDYAYVKSDTEKALSIVREGGLIIWHDYESYHDVTRFLHERSKELPLVRFAGTSVVYAKIESKA